MIWHEIVLPLLVSFGVAAALVVFLVYAIRYHR